MAATDDADGDQYPYNGKVMLAAIISLSIVIFFVLLLHAYARWLLHRRRRQRRSMLVHHSVFMELSSPPQIFPGHAAEARLSIAGVDPKVVAALPVFVYRAAEHEHGVECVVCLSAMEEEESGRRLPKCEHAFHVGCIDMWLASHATCPICRSPVKSEGPAVAEVDAAAAALVVVVESEEQMAAQVEELCAVVNEAGQIEAVVDMKELDESSSPSPSSSSPSPSPSPSSSVDESTSSVTTTPTSFGSSLMRMLSRSGRS